MIGKTIPATLGFRLFGAGGCRIVDYPQFFANRDLR